MACAFNQLNVVKVFCETIEYEAQITGVENAETDDQIEEEDEGAQNDLASRMKNLEANEKKSTTVKSLKEGQIDKLLKGKNPITMVNKDN